MAMQEGIDIDVEWHGMAWAYRTAKTTYLIYCRYYKMVCRGQHWDFRTTTFQDRPREAVRRATESMEQSRQAVAPSRDFFLGAINW